MTSPVRGRDRFVFYTRPQKKSWIQNTQSNKTDCSPSWHSLFVWNHEKQTKTNIDAKNFIGCCIFLRSYSCLFWKHKRHLYRGYYICIRICNVFFYTLYFSSVFLSNWNLLCTGLSIRVFHAWLSSRLYHFTHYCVICRLWYVVCTDNSWAYRAKSCDSISMENIDPTVLLIIACFLTRIVSKSISILFTPFLFKDEFFTDKRIEISFSKIIFFDSNCLLA